MTCKTCQDSGVLTRERSHGGGEIAEMVVGPCPDCSGTQGTGPLVQIVGPREARRIIDKGRKRREALYWRYLRRIRSRR